MGEKLEFQPLTREDKATVLLYRSGIVISTLLVSGLAIVLRTASLNTGTAPAADMLAYLLYASIGMSVFFIHLYIGKFKTFLKNLYYIGLACLGLLLFLGKGSLSAALVSQPYSTLLLLPLSGCLGFITAKEAFCFKLFEGYLLAMFMPLYLLMVAAGTLSGGGVFSGLSLIALMLIVFTLRKVFQPLAWDIGDKSAYR